MTQRATRAAGRLLLRRVDRRRRGVPVIGAGRRSRYQGTPNVAPTTSRGSINGSGDDQDGFAACARSAVATDTCIARDVVGDGVLEADRWRDADDGSAPHQTAPRTGFARIAQLHERRASDGRTAADVDEGVVPGTRRKHKAPSRRVSRHPKRRPHPGSGTPAPARARRGSCTRQRRAGRAGPRRRGKAGGLAERRRKAAPHAGADDAHRSSRRRRAHRSSRRRQARRSRRRQEKPPRTPASTTGAPLPTSTRAAPQPTSKERPHRTPAPMTGAPLPTSTSTTGVPPPTSNERPHRTPAPTTGRTAAAGVDDGAPELRRRRGRPSRGADENTQAPGTTRFTTLEPATAPRLRHATQSRPQETSARPPPTSADLCVER